LGTSGNFSALLENGPLRLPIVRIGANKGALTEEEFLIVEYDRGNDRLWFQIPESHLIDGLYFLIKS
jgi:ribulose-5-phosphate 4-epimerase/fuculose-1-phosphate aldolase